MIQGIKEKIQNTDKLGRFKCGDSSNIKVGTKKYKNKSCRTIVYKCNNINNSMTSIIIKKLFFVGLCVYSHKVMYCTNLFYFGLFPIFYFYTYNKGLLLAVF